MKFNFKKIIVWFQINIIFQDETYNLQGIYTFLQIHIY
jgi:hypothetical protein